MSLKRNDIVVEVRGGVMVAAYSDDPLARVVLVDWDEEEAGGEVAGFYPRDPLSAMSSMTQERYLAAIAGS